MVCFTPASAALLLDALARHRDAAAHVRHDLDARHFTAVPALEHEDRTPWGEYGIGKAAIEDLVLAEAGRRGRRPERDPPSRAHQRARVAGDQPGRRTST